MNTFARLALSSLALSFGLVACGVGSDDDGSGSDNTDAAELSEKCQRLPAGPFQPESLGRPFNGSEDFTFDGRGNMVAKGGNDIVRVNAEGKTTGTVASLPGQTLGLRFHPNGNLVGAMVGAGKLVKVEPNGRVTDLFTGLNGPNGVYVDAGSNVWFTEGGANRVSRLSPDGNRKTIVSGADRAQGANGVVVDVAAKRLYYTEYDKGRIHRVNIADPNASPVEVATIPGGKLDGMVLDACGNLYVVDQGRSKLFRVRLNANGAASRPPELLANFPVNVANAQFGSGDGFDPNKLYVVGNPGSLFALAVGIEGARVPVPGVVSTSSASVSFEVDQTFTAFGTNVFVVGDGAGLGSWNPANAVKLDPTAFPKRSGTITLPRGANVFFKFIKKDAAGNVIWEAGDNRTFKVPDAATGSFSGTWR